MNPLDEKTERLDLKLANRPGSDFDRTEPIRIEQSPKDKQLFALEILSKLAQQYSTQPDFKGLIDFLLRTLSQQFNTPNTFALLQHPFYPGAEHNYFAIGSYVNHEYLKKIRITVEHSNYFMKNRGAQRVKELDLKGRSASLAFMLAECDVELLTPLLHNNNVIGLIGLGSNANKKYYEDYQLDLLVTLVQTIAPFIVNSFHFNEISSVFHATQDLMDHIRQGIFVFDKNDQLKTINSPGFKILRTFKPNVPNIDSLYGVPINWVFPDNIYPGLIQRINLAKKSYEYEYTGILRATQGENQKLYNLYVGQISGNTGEEHNLVVTLDDITSQKTSELKFFELEALAQQANLATSMSEQLGRVHYAIMDGLDLIGASSGVHDSKTLSSLVTTLEDRLKEIERVCVHLMTSNRLTPHKKPGNLNTIIDELLSFVKVQERFRRTTIAKKLDASLRDFEMDEEQIAMLLLQILKNAADAINESQVESGEVIVKTETVAGEAVVSISDNGPGIRSEVKDRLFKTHCSTKGKEHGYSLFTCSKILDGHRCKVEIDSAPGKGTTFRLRFPLP